ncbi:MAG TPA: response regulator [Acidimicrobiales bacterium]|nr:response regulator [Acidimicrobiales bacterium]
MSDRIKVLLGDESRAVRLLLSALLRDDSRFTVIGDVGTGVELLDRSANADLVVVDLMLADIDAFSLIEQLHASRPGLPIVIYAAVDPPYLRAEAAARGAVGFFAHHTDAAEVLDGFAAAAVSSGS